MLPHQEILMIATSLPLCFISMSAHRKTLASRVKGERKKMHCRLWHESNKFYSRKEGWQIQQAFMHLFIWYARQPSSCRETYPAEIDLHSLICLLLQQLSCCRVEGVGCSPDRMTWSHVKLLLVIGSFLFRHCVEGHVARQASRGGLKAKRAVCGC